MGLACRPQRIRLYNDASQAKKKYVESVKTYPGAEVNSDHNPVVMDFIMKRFKKAKHETTNKHVDIEKLNNSEIHEEIGPKIRKKPERIKLRNATGHRSHMGADERCNNKDSKTGGRLQGKRRNG